jgi:hypothetical protein
MAKLSKYVATEGITNYISNGYLHLSSFVTKDRRDRKTTVHPNLDAWLKKYPPTPEALNPGNFPEYQKIREKFAIPFDGLRHTAISAFIAKHGSIALAAQEFGNSETVIRRRYLSRMSATEAEEFYEILPEAS